MKFSDSTRNELKKAWDVNDSKDNEISIWLTKKGIPAKGGNVAVLWSRFSGKGGDIHLEHESSYTGIEQIAVEAAKNHDAVIIAGDKGYKPSSKYDLLANRINTKLKSGRVFNLTEFWTEDSDTLRAWGGNTRFGQFKLYDFLHRNFQEAKHLGFRSGNLEAMAMLGYQVRYMEEPNSFGGDRMTTWHLHSQGRTRKGGLAMGYERLGVFEPPTRSGKYLKAHPEEDKRPNWAPGRKESARKPSVIKSFSKGFNERDLKAIIEYLKPEREKGIISTIESRTYSLQIPEIRFAFMNALKFMGLPFTFAAFNDVEKIYKKLALQYHPDKGGDHEKFILLNQARSILKGDLSFIPEFSPKILAITGGVN